MNRFIDDFKNHVERGRHYWDQKLSGDIDPINTYALLVIIALVLICIR